MYTFDKNSNFIQGEIYHTPREIFYPGPCLLKVKHSLQNKLPAFLDISKFFQISISPTHTLHDSLSFCPGEVPLDINVPGRFRT